MKNSKLISILEMLILIAAGFLVILHPGGSLNVAVRILGIALVAYGAIAALGYFLKKDNGSVLRLIVGVAAVIGGIIVLASPEFVVSVLPIVAGLIIAVAGVRDLIDALHRKSAGLGGWKLALVLSLITIAFGILIFANPFATMETLATILGVALLYNGIAGLITAFHS